MWLIDGLPCLYFSKTNTYSIVTYWIDLLLWLDISTLPCRALVSRRTISGRITWIKCYKGKTELVSQRLPNCYPHNSIIKEAWMQTLKIANNKWATWKGRQKRRAQGRRSRMQFQHFLLGLEVLNLLNGYNPFLILVYCNSVRVLFPFLRHLCSFPQE